MPRKSSHSTRTRQEDHPHTFPIKFWSDKDEYGFLSNFYLCPVWMPLPIAVLGTEAARDSEVAKQAIHVVQTPSPMIGNSVASAASACSIGDGQATATAPMHTVLLPFASNEHYFQAMKFPLGSDAFYACADASSPFAAKRAGGNRSVPIHASWDAPERNVVMLDVLRAKFGGAHHHHTHNTNHNNPTQLGDALLATGDQKLVEASPFDGYWGTGRDGNGLNMLGRLLMQVRSELRLLAQQQQQHAGDGDE